MCFPIFLPHQAIRSTISDESEEDVDDSDDEWVEHDDDVSEKDEEEDDVDDDSKSFSVPPEKDVRVDEDDDVSISSSLASRAHDFRCLPLCHSFLREKEDY